MGDKPYFQLLLKSCVRLQKNQKDMVVNMGLIEVLDTIYLEDKQSTHVEPMTLASA